MVCCAVWKEYYIFALLTQITDLNLLVCDECHRAVKKDPYNCIMQEFYHDRSTEVGVPCCWHFLPEQQLSW